MCKKEHSYLYGAPVHPVQPQQYQKYQYQLETAGLRSPQEFNFPAAGRASSPYQLQLAWLT
jgi:hypothetical protein